MRMDSDHCIHGAFHVLCFTIVQGYVLCDCVIDIHGVMYMEKD